MLKLYRKNKIQGKNNVEHKIAKKKIDLYDIVPSRSRCLGIIFFLDIFFKTQYKIIS